MGSCGTACVLDLEILKQNYNKKDFLKSYYEDDDDDEDDDDEYYNDEDDDDDDDDCNFPNSLKDYSYEEIYIKFINSIYTREFENSRFVLTGGTYDNENDVCDYIMDMCTIARISIY